MSRLGTVAEASPWPPSMRSFFLHGFSWFRSCVRWRRSTFAAIVTPTSRPLAERPAWHTRARRSCPPYGWFVRVLAFAALAVSSPDVRAAHGTSRTCNAGLQHEAHSTPDKPVHAVEIDLQARVKDIELVDAQGQLYVRSRHNSELVPAEAWLRALEAAEAEQRAHGFLYVLFNVTQPWSFVWVAVGFAGQALFTLRMLLQWYASERERRSVIPVGFWWGSLFGGLLLLVYFAWRKDIVGIVGQSTGLIVYARNLVLIRRNARRS